MKRTGIIALILVSLLCMNPAMAARQYRFSNSMRGLECTIVSRPTPSGCTQNNSASSGCTQNNSASSGCTQNNSASSGCGQNNTAPSQPATGGDRQEPDAPAGQSNASLAQAVVDQTNMERQKAGLAALKVSSELTRAACVRAGEIVRQFSHTRPDGSQWLTVSDAARGENIAKGQQTVDKVMAAWMSSSGHRANILRASFGSIGVCAYRVGNVLYWVQLFGK